MKKNAIKRAAKASSRQSTLNFPTSSEADLVAEAAAETSIKSGAKNRRKRTADFADDADKHNESHCDSSAISAQSAVKTDAPQIPNGWCWTTFKDATINFDGQRVPIKKEDRDRRSGEYAYYGASGIIDDIDDFLFDGEFLLVAEDGANLLSRSTPIAFRASGKFWVNNHAHVVQPANGVALRFIEYYLNSIDLKFFVSGSAQPKLNQANLNKIPIPLPRLSEQHRIVAEIEKQFTRLDAGVAALKRVQANLKRYRAAVLKTACEGKLVPTEAKLARHEGRTYETGEQLFQRILTERRQAWQCRGLYKEPTEPVTAHLGQLPEGWAVASLEQLTSVMRPICYGILMPKENVASGVLFVKVKDMKGDTIDLEGLHRTTPEIAAQYARASLRTGDLLLSIRGTYGRVAEVPKELDGGNITQDTARLDVTCLVDHRYVATCLRNPDCQNHFKRVARGVAVKGVNIGDVRPTPVPLPPIAEQMRIVADVERRLSIVEELAAVVAENLQRANRLRQTILHSAFRGELNFNL